MSRALNELPQGGLVYVEMPDPDQLAEQVMAIHHILELLIAQHYTPTGLEGQRADIATDVVPILRHVSEQARLAACSIDRLARAG